MSAAACLVSVMIRTTKSTLAATTCHLPGLFVQHVHDGGQDFVGFVGPIPVRGLGGHRYFNDQSVSGSASVGPPVSSSSVSVFNTDNTEASHCSYVMPSISPARRAADHARN